MMRCGVLEYDRDMELARHARGQLMDFTGDIEVRKVDNLLDLPGTASRMIDDLDGLLVLIPLSDERHAGEVLKLLMRVEVDSGVPVEKVVVEKNGMNRHDFRNQAQGLSMERAEVLIKKIERS